MESERQLTELEGAVLSGIEFQGNNTAYRVRRAFETSPSVHWRGSAGAVSPAIKRLVGAGLIESLPHPSRRGRTLSLTRSGRAALSDWATDIELACGLGLDPFRLRSGVWEQLPAGRRRTTYARLERLLEEMLDQLEQRSSADGVDSTQTELAIELVKGRLRWLRRL